MARIQIIPNRVIGTNGIADGAAIHAYLTGTTTPASLFSNEDLTIPVENPYVVPAGAAVPILYYDNRQDVRVRVVQDDGTVLQDDDIYASVVFASEVDEALSTVAAGAETATDAAAAAALSAEQAALVANSSGFYPGARDYVPQGATGHGAITGGSGGTNGTFALAFTGGNFDVDPSATFTVTAGAVTDIAITGPGLYIGNAISAPTLDFSASAGLTGASATLTTGFLVGAGEYYTTDHATDPDLLSLFQNVAGVATESVADYPVSAAKSINAATASEAARDVILAMQPDTNTRFAEASLAGLRAADVNGLLVPGRPSAVGVAFSAVFDGPTYTHGLARIPFAPTLEYERAGNFAAMAGGSSETFAADAPPILDGRLFLDGGGTNVVPQPTDFTNAAWTKTNMGTPTLTTGPGGADTAYAVRETTTSAAHQLSQIISGLASEDQFTLHWLIKPVGRDYAYVTVQNASTAKNFQARFSFLTGAFLTNYPAGSGATAIDGGVLDYGDGWFLVWLTGTFTAAETGLRIFLGTMSNSTTTSFAGDTNKGLDVAAIWGVQGSGVPINYPGAGTSAATLDVPLGAGYYFGRRVDGAGTVSEPLVIEEMGDRWSLAPRTNGLWLTEAQTYPVDLYDDTSAQSDSAHGATITPTYGPVLVPYKYPGSFPMEAATNGRVASGKFEVVPQSGEDGTTYWVADFGEGAGAKFAACTLHIEAATAGGDAISNMSLCIAFCQNDIDNVTEEMVVHVVFTSEGFVGQYRTIADGFVTRSNLQRNDGGTGTTDVAVVLHGDKLSVTMWDQTITTQDEAFEAADPRRVFFELQSTSNNTTRTYRFSDPVAGVLPVGPEPEYVASVPVNITDATHPFAVGTAVAGNTYVIARGYWTSNDGPLTFTQKWQFDLADIVPPATAISYVTTNGVDEGKKIRVGERASNDSGQAADYVYSPESAALA